MMKLFGGLLTVGLVALLAILFVAIAASRFGLVTIQPTFWLFVMGIIFVICGGWLVSAKFPGGKIFASLGAVLLILGGVKAIWPNASAATGKAQEVADLQAALALNSTIAPRPVRCDRDSVTQFWDQTTGLAVVYYRLDVERQRIECADRKGFHPVTRQEYKPVTEAIIGIIRKQDPPPPPPAPMPTPIPTLTVVAVAPMVVATPLPQLSEGPCCEGK